MNVSDQRMMNTNWESKGLIYLRPELRMTIMPKQIQATVVT